MPNHPPIWQKYVEAVKRETVPALGCTEPISLALASAVARQYLGEIPEHIEAKVSANLMKNGMGVTVPGTGMVGLPIAAAVGATGGDPQAGLEVLKTLTPESIQAGKQMLLDKKISIEVAQVPYILYSEVRATKGKHWVKVCIAEAHTRIILIEKDGELLFELDEFTNASDADNVLSEASAQSIYHFATTAPFSEISFILEAAHLNARLSDEGLENNYGLHIGTTLRRQVDRGLLSNDLQTQIVIRTSAASDARMGGASLPAMSNSGSGNQGIMATMPVVVVAEHTKVDEETLARALILSHLMAIYIHSKLPKLSALCAVTTAAMGAASGIAWLMRGGFGAVSMAICNMIGDVSGMICDGASNSCAMKVSTSAAAAYKAVLMALDDSRVTGHEGIVDEDVDASIANLCALASGSMQETDRQILQIMTSKKNLSTTL